MDLDYSKIIKVLNTYGQSGVKQLINIVGVDTGRLKASIEYDINQNNKLHFSWLSYGAFINPWKKKTGWTSKPGYKKVLDNNFYKSLSSDLEKVITKDLSTKLVEDIKKINQK